MEKTIVSFTELKNEQLKTWPITPGEIIFVTDTQTLYKTTIEGVRQEFSSVSIVESLPTENFIPKHLYLIPEGPTRGFYINIDNTWIKLNAGEGSGTGGIIVSEDEPLTQNVGDIWFMIRTGEEEF